MHQGEAAAEHVKIGRLIFPAIIEAVGSRPLLRAPRVFTAAHPGPVGFAGMEGWIGIDHVDLLLPFWEEGE
jgi:hypothetical protein